MARGVLDAALRPDSGDVLFLDNSVTDVTADQAVALKDYENCRTVEATADATTDSYTITLPPMQNWRREIIVVWMLDPDTASKTITVSTYGDSKNTVSHVLNGADDYCVLYNDGLRVHTLLSTITP